MGSEAYEAERRRNVQHHHHRHRLRGRSPDAVLVTGAM
jgi:hypothetical protein